MKWLRAIWQAIIALLASLKSDNDKEQQEAQHIQDEIVQETQHEIEEVPNKTDDELTDIAIDTGLVQLVQPISEGSGGTRKLGTGNSEYSGRPPGSSFKTKY